MVWIIICCRVILCMPDFSSSRKNFSIFFAVLPSHRTIGKALTLMANYQLRSNCFLHLKLQIAVPFSASGDGFCFCLGIREIYILNDAVNLCTLCEYIVATIMFLQVDTKIVGLMSSGFLCQSPQLKAPSDVGELVLQLSPSSAPQQKTQTPNRTHIYLILIAQSQDQRIH